MNEIDWSKAPEGATHQNARSPFLYWYKLEGGSFFYWQPDDSEWFPSVSQFDYLAATLTPRPAPQWSGDGLPPVGAFCEVDYCEQWHQCEVIAHFQQRCGMVAAFTVLHDNGAKSLDAFGESAFRPIRTEAQIAAEEREKAVQDMLALDPYLPNTMLGMMSREDFCRTLYDAGWRRVNE